MITRRERRSRPDFGLVEFGRECPNQRGEVLAVCRRMALMPNRGRPTRSGLFVPADSERISARAAAGAGAAGARRLEGKMLDGPHLRLAPRPPGQEEGQAR